MRIAVISYHTCPFEEFGRGFSGGMNSFLRETSLRLSLSGYRVVVFTRDIGGLGRAFKHDFLEVRHVDCGLPESPTLADYLNGVEKFTGSLLELKENEFDVVFSNYWLSVLPAITLKRTLGVPIVHMHHTLEAVKEEFSGTRYDDERLRQSRLFYEFHAHREADVVLYPSEMDREVSLRFYGWAADRAEVVTPGIDDMFFDLPDMRERGREILGAGADEIVILFSGRDERIKNLKGLMEAFDRVREKYNLKLAVLGGWKGENLEGVSVLPPTFGEELVAVIDGADLVAIPSFYESFSIFGFEALVRGRLLLAPRGTYIGEFVSRHGLGEVFSPREGDLGEALERLVCNLEKHGSKKGEAKSLCSRFTWEMTHHLLIQVFHRVVRPSLRFQ